MANLFTTILNMSLTACIIILIVLLARQCLKKVPKIFSYVLWSVVLFRLLCPVSISLPVSILAPMSGASTSAGTSYTASMEYISLPERNESEQTQRPVPGENGTQGNAAGADADVSTAPLSPIAPETATSHAVVEQKMSAGEIVLTVLGWVWVAGMAGVLGMTAWQTIVLKRRLADAFIIRGNIFESDKIDTAFILGVINPKIYLPLGLPFDVQKAIVAHEQTHQRRGDHIVKLVSYTALAIHWFNPLVWLSFKMMCDDMEKSCDEAVLRTMNDRGYSMDSTKKAYGHMLLALGNGKPYLFSPVSFAENNTKGRVMNVIEYKSVARNVGIGLIAVCILVCFLCIINPNGTDADKSDSDESSVSHTDTDNNTDVLSHSPDAYRITTDYGTFWSDTSELELRDGTDLSVIKEFPNLTSLTLLDVATDDYSPLLDCPGLTHLEIGGFDLTDLSFLEYCPNLISFKLSYSYVTDLSPLRYCPNLEALEIAGLRSYTESGGEISGVSVIGTLSELRSLILYSDFFAGVDFGLENLKRLEHLDCLYLDLSRLNDIPWITSLNAYIRNQSDIDVISALEQLEKLQVTVVYPADVNSSTEEFIAAIDKLDFSPFGRMRKLSDVMLLTNVSRYTEVSYNKEYVYQLAAGKLLNSLPADSIASLYLYDCFNIGSENGECLRRFTRLEELGFDAFDNTLSLDFLDDAVYLQDLIVRSEGTLDLSCLANISSLESLYITAGKVTGIDALDALHNLKHLKIIGAGVDDISFCKGLSKLEYLDIQLANQNVDISAFSSLTRLKTLNLLGGVSDISELAQLYELQSVHLCDIYTESVSELDISPLSGKENLTSLTLTNYYANLSHLYTCPRLSDIRLFVADSHKDAYYNQVVEFNQQVNFCNIIIE